MLFRHMMLPGSVLNTVNTDSMVPLMGIGNLPKSGSLTAKKWGKAGKGIMIITEPGLLIGNTEENIFTQINCSVLAMKP